MRSRRKSPRSSSSARATAFSLPNRGSTPAVSLQDWPRQPQPTTLLSVSSASTTLHISGRKAFPPFFDGEQLLLRDKVDRAELGAFTESVAQARSAAALRMLGFRSRRDWHFGRCRRYYDFAHGGKQA